MTTHIILGLSCVAIGYCLGKLIDLARARWFREDEDETEWEAWMRAKDKDRD